MPLAQPVKRMSYHIIYILKKHMQTHHASSVGLGFCAFLCNSCCFCLGVQFTLLGQASTLLLLMLPFASRTMLQSVEESLARVLMGGE